MFSFAAAPLGATNWRSVSSTTVAPLCASYATTRNCTGVTCRPSAAVSTTSGARGIAKVTSARAVPSRVVPTAKLCRTAFHGSRISGVSESLLVPVWASSRLFLMASVTAWMQLFSTIVRSIAMRAAAAAYSGNNVPRRCHSPK